MYRIGTFTYSEIVGDCGAEKRACPYIYMAVRKVAVAVQSSPPRMIPRNI